MRLKTTGAPETTYVHWLQEQHGQPELLRLLDDEERQRAASYTFDRHRNLYIVAHVFLRKVLSFHLGLPSEDWRFDYNSYGKPCIKNAPFQSIHFNLSHTKGMIVCAINKTYEVGVDVEGSRPLKYLEQMSRRNYTEQEYNDIFSLIDPEKRLHRFYTYWTLKESLVKALGCGLSMPLNKVGFQQEVKGSWTLETDLRSYNETLNNHYHFNHKQLPNNYQMAVSVKSGVNKINNPKFCFINSNHKDSQYWNKQALS